MSRCSPFRVVLSPDDSAVLEERASSRTAGHAEVVRARIVLLAAEGVQNVEIARRVRVSVDVASRAGGSASVRQVWPACGTGHGQGDHGASVTRSLPASKAMACERPEQRHVPLSRGARPTSPSRR
jgi:hypothetical protein